MMLYDRYYSIHIQKYISDWGNHTTFMFGFLNCMCECACTWVGEHYKTSRALICYIIAIVGRLTYTKL